MTNQPNDIDQRLQTLEQNFNSYRSSSQQSIQELQSLTSELLSIAQLHQQCLRIAQRDAEQDRAETRAERERASQDRALMMALIQAIAQGSNGHL